MQGSGLRIEFALPRHGVEPGVFAGGEGLQAGKQTFMGFAERFAAENSVGGQLRHQDDFGLQAARDSRSRGMAHGGSEDFLHLRQIVESDDDERYRWWRLLVGVSKSWYAQPNTRTAYGRLADAAQLTHTNVQCIRIGPPA